MAQATLSVSAEQAHTRADGEVILQRHDDRNAGAPGDVEQRARQAEELLQVQHVRLQLTQQPSDEPLDPWVLEVAQRLADAEVDRDRTVDDLVHADPVAQPALDARRAEAGVAPARADVV